MIAGINASLQGLDNLFYRGTLLAPEMPKRLLAIEQLDQATLGILHVSNNRAGNRQFLYRYALPALKLPNGLHGLRYGCQVPFVLLSWPRTQKRECKLKNGLCQKVCVGNLTVTFN